jgi:hypothetical protein
VIDDSKWIKNQGPTVAKKGAKIQIAQNQKGKYCIDKYFLIISIY